MVNGVVVIDRDGKENSYSIDSGGFHKEALLKYLKDNDLGYDDFKDEMGYNISLYLASIGDIVICIENYRHCYYIGEDITDKQNK